MNAMLPAHLSETLNSLGDAARALTEEVREDRTRRIVEARAVAAEQRRQNRITVALLAIVAILVIGLMTIGVQNRARSSQNAQILRQTARTSAQIADCTTAGGTCYRQGGQRTSDAALMIIRAMIYQNSCAKVTGTDAEVEQCVLRKLRRSAPPATPAPAPQRQPVSPAPSK